MTTLPQPFFMAGMPLTDPAPTRELPEFAFSPRQSWLSRAAACAGCDRAIHEAKGERNHSYFGEYDGPYCPDCALRIRMAHVRKVERPDLRLRRPAPQPLRVIGRTGPASAYPRYARQKPATAGGADPTWVTRFTTKFAQKPD